jgi:hypothetical protein
MSVLDKHGVGMLLSRGYDFVHSHVEFNPIMGVAARFHAILWRCSPRFRDG